MVLNLETLISSEVREAVDRGELSPYLVCRVELYVTEESAKKEGRQVNMKRAVRIREGVSQFVGMKYFLSNHYLIVDIRFEQTYPCTDIPELAHELSRMRVRNYGSLAKTVLEQDDEDSAYVWAPLTGAEDKGLKLAREASGPNIIFK